MPSEKTIAQKLQLKSGRSVYFANPPGGYERRLGALPAEVIVVQDLTNPVDVIQVFVASRQELEALLPGLKSALKPGGALWVTYYKGTSKIKTDIHRDSINAYARTLGMTGVAMISIDEDWSALRLQIVG